MKKKIFIAAAVIFSSTLHAQRANLVIPDSLKLLDEIIITANKIEQKQNETGKVLTVINQQELQRSAGKTIGEVLNQQVGISIGGANSTLGSVQTVYTRGSTAANTLILLDGVPLYDASGITSEFDLNTFALDQVDRIEILKGAQSTLYGSDAVAGVINIITKKHSDKKVQLNVNGSAGTYNTYRGGINISGTGKMGLSYFAGYSKIYSDGLSSAYDSTGKNNFDDDGYKQDAIVGSIGFKPVENFNIKLYGKYNLNKAQIDAGAFTDDKDYSYQTKNMIAGANMKYQLKNMSLHFNYNFNNYERKYNNDSADIGGFSTDPYAFYTKFIKERYKGKSHFVELYSNINVHKNVNLVGGIDYRTNATSQESIFISNYGPFISLPIGEDTAKSNQFSTYASFLYNNQHGFTAGIGGRYNDHSIYGSNGTFSINPSYSFNKIKIFANISSAYRVPSLYQLYSDYGNRKLKPEKSISYESGVQYSGKGITVRAVGFKRDIKDVFVFYTDPVSFNSIYKNEDKQKDYGIELEAAYTVSKNILVSANYTYINGKIDTKNFDGKDTAFSNLYRRPKNLFNINFTFVPVSKVLISAHLRSVGSFYEPKFGSAPLRLKGYYTMDLYSEYKFCKMIKVFIDLKNITDQKYFDQQGFNTRRFNMNGGISVSL